jgi:hypothetical protein
MGDAFQSGSEARTYRRAYGLAADRLRHPDRDRGGPALARGLARLRAEIAQELGAESARALELIASAVADAAEGRRPAW